MESKKEYGKYDFCYTRYNANVIAERTPEPWDGITITTRDKEGKTLVFTVAGLMDGRSSRILEEDLNDHVAAFLELFYTWMLQGCTDVPLSLLDRIPFDIVDAMSVVMGKKPAPRLDRIRRGINAGKKAIERKQSKTDQFVKDLNDLEEYRRNEEK